jgi:hypothetical protein
VIQPGAISRGFEAWGAVFAAITNLDVTFVNGFPVKVSRVDSCLDA